MSLTDAIERLNDACAMMLAALSQASCAERATIIGSSDDHHVAMTDLRNAIAAWRAAPRTMTFDELFVEAVEAAGNQTVCVQHSRWCHGSYPAGSHMRHADAWSCYTPDHGHQHGKTAAEALAALRAAIAKKQGIM